MPWMLLQMVSFIEYKAKFYTHEVPQSIQTSHLLCTGDCFFYSCVVLAVDLHIKSWPCLAEPEYDIDDGHFGMQSEFYIRFVYLTDIVLHLF